MRPATPPLQGAVAIESRRAGLWWLVAVTLLYAFFAYALAPTLPHPSHPDDYALLSGRLADLSLHWKRPVFANIAILLATAGPVTFYLAVNVATVLVAWAAMRLVCIVLDARASRPVVVAAMLAAAVLVMSHASTFEHGRYIGLVTNLTSHAFGIASLYLLWYGARARRWPLQAAAFVAYVLSAMSKEDFLLPPLLMAALLWAMAWREERSWTAMRPHMLRLMAFAVAGAATLAWNVYDHSPFVSGLVSAKASDAPYAVHATPSGVVTVIARMFFGFTPLATMLSLVSAGWLWWARPGARLQVAWAVLTILSLALPYALIPNNMPAYRAFAWLPWMGGLVAAAIMALDAPLRARVRAWPIVASVAVVLLAVLMQQRSRSEQAQFYARREALNRAMLASLERLRPAIAHAQVVALSGLPVAVSPWCGHSPLYLRRKRGFPQQWVVLTEAQGGCYTDTPPGPYAHDHQDIRRQVEPPAWRCRHPQVPLIAFDADGRGTLVSARCPAGVAHPVEAGRASART